MNRHRRRSVSNEEIGLQIAPMIDVTMLLLFFFMLSTTLGNKNTTAQIKVPITKHTAEYVSRKNSIVVVICKTGEAMVNGRITSHGDLHSEITRQAMAKETAKPVGEIHADAHTNGATIKKVMSAFSASGISEVSYAVENH
jgi:biopolymer transport protein ExbD